MPLTTYEHNSEYNFKCVNSNLKSIQAIKIDKLKMYIRQYYQLNASLALVLLLWEESGFHVVVSSNLSAGYDMDHC